MVQNLWARKEVNLIRKLWKLFKFEHASQEAGHGQFR